MKKMYLRLSMLFSLACLGNLAFAVVPTTNSPAPPTTLTGSKVISIFSDAYENGAGATDFFPNWGSTTSVSVVSISGSNAALKYSTFGYQGIVLGTNVNAANMVFLHVDIYTEDETNLMLTPISPGKEILVKLAPLTLNQWNSFDIPIISFPGVDFANVTQFKFDGARISSTVYVDNLYFWDNKVADTQIPTVFTATKGLVTSSSVELLLNATDNTAAINYIVNYNTTTVNVGGLSGIQKSFVIDNLTPSTAYSFSVTAKDAAGNTASSSPITVVVTTASPLVGAPTPPALAADKVISIFSDAFANLQNSNYNPNWGQSTQVSFATLTGGNVALKYSNLNYQGTEYASTNASAMTHLHIDVYTDNETSLKITPISPATPNNKEFLIALTPITLGSWKGYDIPLDNFTGVDKSKFFQMKIEGSGGKTVYLDNIYFWKNVTTVVGPPVKPAANLPLIFDDSTAVKYTIIDFAGDTLSAIVPDPSNAANLVLKSVRNPAVKGFADYAGTTIAPSLPKPIAFAPGQTKVTARVYSPDANTLICLKAEGAGPGAESLALTTAVGWNNLTFDFGVVSTVGGRTSSKVSIGADYTKLTVFYNFFVPGATQAVAKTYYIDEIKLITITSTFVGVVKLKPSLPITFDDSTTVFYAIRDFAGDTLSAIVPDPTNAANLVLKSVRNPAVKGFADYAGTTITDFGTAGPIPFAAGNTKVTAKVYSPDANTLICLKAEGAGPGAESLALTTAVGWNTLTFDFGVVSTVGGRNSQTIQLGKDYTKLTIFYNFFVPGSTQAVAKTYYIDDIKFAATTQTYVVKDLEINDFSVYPNPSDGAFTVESSHAASVNFLIINSHGLVVKSGLLNNGRNYVGGDLHPGVYFLKASGTVKKLIVR